MDAFLPFLPFLSLAGGLAAVLGFFTWLAARVRRRGLAGGAMSAALASYEEAFRTTAHASHVEIRAQAERKAPVLSPDGHWGRNPGETGAGAGTGTGAVRAEAEAEGRRPGPSRTRRSRRALSRWAARLSGPGR